MQSPVRATERIWVVRSKVRAEGADGDLALGEKGGGRRSGLLPFGRGEEAEGEVLLTTYTRVGVETVCTPPSVN